MTTVLAFFKNSCPVCQMAFPVYGRMAAGGAPVVAVSQDAAAAARPWLAERGFDGELVDDSAGYPLSNEHGITTVPTLVVVEDDGRVGEVVVGWDRDATNALAARFGLSAVSEPGDGLPAFKPG